MQFGPLSIEQMSEIDGDHTTFNPHCSADECEADFARWQRAVERARGWSEG